MQPQPEVLVSTIIDYISETVHEFRVQNEYLNENENEIYQPSRFTSVSLTLVTQQVLGRPLLVGYEPADLTVHPPPPELPRVGSFFSYRCLVFPKKCPQWKACAFRNY